MSARNIFAAEIIQGGKGCLCHRGGNAEASKSLLGDAWLAQS